MSRLTWQNVAAPDTGNSITALTQANTAATDAINKALGSIGSGIDTYKGLQQEAADRAIALRMSRFMDPAKYAEALQNDEIVGPDLRNASLAQINAAQAYRSSLADYDKKAIEAEEKRYDFTDKKQADALARAADADLVKVQQLRLLGKIDEANAFEANSPSIRALRFGQYDSYLESALANENTVVSNRSSRYEQDQEEKKEALRIRSIELAQQAVNNSTDNAGGHAYLKSLKLSPEEYALAANQLDAVSGKVGRGYGAPADPLAKVDALLGGVRSEDTSPQNREYSPGWGVLRSSAGMSDKQLSVPVGENPGNKLHRVKGVNQNYNLTSNVPITEQTGAQLMDTAKGWRDQTRGFNGDPTIGASPFGAYGLVGSTYERYAPKVIPDWKNQRVTLENQDLVAEAVFKDSNKSVASLRAQWPSLTQQQAAELVRTKDWGKARSVIAKAESGQGDSVDRWFNSKRGAAISGADQVIRQFDSVRAGAEETRNIGFSPQEYATALSDRRPIDVVAKGLKERFPEVNASDLDDAAKDIIEDLSKEDRARMTPGMLNLAIEKHIVPASWGVALGAFNSEYTSIGGDAVVDVASAKTTLNNMLSQNANEMVHKETIRLSTEAQLQEATEVANALRSEISRLAALGRVQGKDYSREISQRSDQLSKVNALIRAAVGRTDVMPETRPNRPSGSTDIDLSRFDISPLYNPYYK
jgi:hypothetical protein